MRVRFRHTGGVAGLVRGCELDTERLGSEEAETLRSLVERSGLEASSETTSSDARDVQRYEITIVRAEGRCRIVVDDLSLSPEIEPLVAYLVRHAGPEPP